MTDDSDDFHKLHERQRSAYNRPNDDPVDPDIALINDYLAEALSCDEEAVVERRMKDDEAFFEKVWPLVNAWQQSGEVPISSQRVRRGLGTFTDEIRSIALHRTPPQPQAPWFVRLAKFFRRTRPT